MWFKVDDSFWGHAKRVAVPTSAVGLWVIAGSWCGQQLTDGHVPGHMLSVLGGKPKDAAALVTAGLWEQDPHIGGWWFHDWSDWQPSAAKVREDRAKEAARKAEYRAKRAAGHELQAPPPDDYVPPGHEGGVPPGQQRPSRVRPRAHGTRPDQTRPRSSEPADAGSAADGGAATLDLDLDDPGPPTGGPTAQDLVAEWIDHCEDRPPGRVVGQVAKELATMLAEGIPAAVVRAGLVAWHGKGLHPSTLASVTHETRTVRPPRQSTADSRAAAAQALKPKFAALDAADAARQLNGGGGPLAIEGIAK